MDLFNPRNKKTTCVSYPWVIDELTMEREMGSLLWIILQGGGAGWVGESQWAEGGPPKQAHRHLPSLPPPIRTFFLSPSTTPHSGRSTPNSSPSLRKRLQLLPPSRPPPEPEPGTMVEKGSDSSSEKGGVSGTPSTQSLGSRNFIRNSKVGASSGGVGVGWEDRDSGAPSDSFPFSCRRCRAGTV